MVDELKAHIREVPDYPRPGIQFYDITTLLKNPATLREAVDRFVWLFLDHDVDKVIGTESRGFILAPIVAYNLRAGFVPVRKAGKLPASTRSESYELEYGTDELEIHEDAIEKGERVLIVDDLMATGGTALASARLAEQAGGEVVGLGFLIELTFLEGRKKLAGYEVHSLIQY